MKIKFCGAAQEVTGSAHLITLENGFTILLDCGLFQGYSEKMKNFNSNWLFDPKEIDCLVLSHAHIDHSGRIPKLVKDGFSGPIYCTHATQSLCAIMLLDSAKIQERDTEYYNKRQLRKNKLGAKLKEPLYTSSDIPKTIKRYSSFPYDHWFPIHKDVEVLFRDAGHILGSASVTLRIKEKGTTKMLGFTGDIGRPNRPILRDPDPLPKVDFLICESTYGDRVHLEAPNESKKLLKIIENTCVQNRGKLLIPAFSIGRTQEVVYILDQLESAQKLPRVKVFVDSPLAVNATSIFASHPECYDAQLLEYMLVDQNPFGFNDLNYVRELEKSKEINTLEEPCIIISASGMMNAGRSKHHLSNTIENPRNTILLVGYCSPETPGGKLLRGDEKIRLFGQEKKVKANVQSMDSFSAHADQVEMLEFIQNQKGNVKEIFLVHGTNTRQEKFQKYLADNGFKQVKIPTLGENFLL